MRRLPPFFIPPSLPLRQAASMLLLGVLARWRHMPWWLVRHGMRCAPGAAGALGMGCIGFPVHAVWEMTARCNLDCIHCHARGSRSGYSELSTEEGKGLLREIADTPGFRMIAFTGGEPLMRDDLFELLGYAQELGLSNTIATNATLLDWDTARELKASGVAIAAVSLDGCDALTHDRIRGMNGAFERAIEGIRALNGAGIPLHINVTVMEKNLDELQEIVKLVDELDAAILLIYQLIPIGRGREIADSALCTEEHEQLVRFMAGAQASCRAVIEPVAAPQYWVHLLHRQGIHGRAVLPLAGRLFHGCCAGRGFVYIKPDGEVWPCPFLEIPCGSVRGRPFREVYDNSPILKSLRMRGSALKGRCGRCRYRMLCGGCRARAHAFSGDYMQEDPYCFIAEERDGNNGS